MLIVALLILATTLVPAMSTRADDHERGVYYFWYTDETYQEVCGYSWYPCFGGIDSWGTSSDWLLTQNETCHE
jgi:hypothetical protein